MGSKLYVGNLSYDVTGAELNTMFTPHGTVSSAEIIQDRETGRSKGFGFVQMGTDQEAQAAIGALNGQEQNGRALTVNEAKPREERPRNGGGGSYGGGGSRNNSSTRSAPIGGYVERGASGGRTNTDRDTGNKRY
jgi:RNA recognition motif-containing protein